MWFKVRRSLFAIVAVAAASQPGCGGSKSSANDAAVTGVAGTGGQGPGTAGTTGASGTTGAGGTTGVAGTTGTAGAAGRGGAGGTTGTAGVTGAAGTGGGTLADLGKACSAATDCTGGLTCMRATDSILDGTSGPAHGYCTKACVEDVDCLPGGACLNTAAIGAPVVGHCFKTCTFGGPAGTAKCHGRLDVGCVTLDNTASPTLDVCYPICSQDSDCPAGRKCDLGSSQCTDTPRTGDPLGTHCTRDPDGGASSCAGGCLPIGSSAGGTTAVASFCSMLCVIGNLQSCNWVGAGVPLSGGGVHGVCALSSAGAMPGDIGYCTQECDTASECRNQTDPGVTCDLSAMSAVGHGFCTW